MNKNATSIVAFLSYLGGILGIALELLSWVGPYVVWAIAYFAGDKEGAKFYLNQSLVILIARTIINVIGLIPILGTIIALILGIILLVFWIIGLVHAIKQDGQPVPLLGSIQILK